MAAGGNHITPKSEKNVHKYTTIQYSVNSFFLLQNAEYRERRNTY